MYKAYVSPKRYVGLNTLIVVSQQLWYNTRMDISFEEFLKQHCTRNPDWRHYYTTVEALRRRYWQMTTVDISPSDVEAALAHLPGVTVNGYPVRQVTCLAIGHVPMPPRETPPGPLAAVNEFLHASLPVDENSRVGMPIVRAKFQAWALANAPHRSFMGDWQLARYLRELGCEIQSRSGVRSLLGRRDPDAPVRDGQEAEPTGTDALRMEEFKAARMAPDGCDVAASDVRAAYRAWAPEKASSTDVMIGRALAKVGLPVTVGFLNGKTCRVIKNYRLTPELLDANILEVRRQHESSCGPE